MHNANIILIGPMGAGKTTIGRHLARRLKKTFLDSDHEIEKHTGAAVGLIFEIEGETGFRKRETQMLEKLARRKNIVLATGGGAVLAEQNRRILRKCGTVVYLHTSIATQMKRTANNKNRPLLHNQDPQSKLESLMQIREPLYRQEADVVVISENRSIHVIVAEIIKSIERLDA